MALTEDAQADPPRRTQNVTRRGHSRRPPRLGPAREALRSHLGQDEPEIGRKEPIVGGNEPELGRRKLDFGRHQAKIGQTGGRNWPTSAQIRSKPPAPSNVAKTGSRKTTRTNIPSGFGIEWHSPQRPLRTLAPPQPSGLGSASRICTALVPRLM